MASIKQRSQKSYQIRVYIGEDLHGSKQFKNVTYHPTSKTPKAIEKEVQAFALDFERKVLNGTYLSGEEMTVNQFYRIWQTDYAGLHLTEHEIEDYKHVIERVFLPSLGNRKINSITAFQLQSIITVLQEKGLKPSTINRYFDCISSLLTRAYKANIISENPCRRVLLPRIERDPSKIQFFDRAEALLFLSALTKQYTISHPQKKRKNGRVIPAYTEVISISLQFRAYFTLALYSGLRRGEMISLCWKDIDFKKNRISITKSTTSTSQKGQYCKEPKTKAGIRTLTVPDSCIKLLSNWKEEEIKLCETLGTAWEGAPIEQFDVTFVFIQANGSQMHLSTPTHKFKEILTYYNSSVSDPADKLPMITLHDLRHTSASLMIAAGDVDIETIARRMGHADVSVTLNTYGHALPSQDDKASSALEKMLG